MRTCEREIAFVIILKKIRFNLPTEKNYLLKRCFLLNNSCWLYSTQKKEDSHLPFLMRGKKDLQYFYWIQFHQRKELKPCLASRGCPPPPPRGNQLPQNTKRNHNTLHVEGAELQTHLEAKLGSPVRRAWLWR